MLRALLLIRALHQDGVLCLCRNEPCMARQFVLPYLTCFILI